MALFNLDIERYYKKQNDEGFELKSIAYIQYPIYCIHATIMDSTPDPLEKLDKAIIKCLLLKKGMTNISIAQFLSVHRIAVDLRIQKFKSDKLLKGDKNLIITDLGKEVLLDEREKRLLKRSYDFYLDGIDFHPLNKEFYGNRYKKSFYSENEYSYYTNRKGETKVNKPFRPNIVHEPIDKERVINKILNIDKNERHNYSIPDGLENIENIDFTKMTVPILIGIFIKNGMPHRKLINGYSVLGEIDAIQSFESKIEDKINKLELRLDVWDDKNGNDKKFTFASNWSEIDRENADNRLQFISNEDLKTAYCKFYRCSEISDENILNDERGLGINVTAEFLIKLKQGKKKILHHLLRGRDYHMFSTNNGVWLVFITFSTDCPFVKSLLEILSFFNDAKKMQLTFDHKIKRISQYDNYRKALVILEEYEFLETIDIRQHMYIIED